MFGYLSSLLTISNILWLVYFALLVVLLPHLAWMANQFEPTGQKWVGWAFAIAFELTVAAFTHKLKQYLENMPKDHKGKGWRKALSRFWYQVANPFSVGLAFFVSVSALGNLAHAWEFGKLQSLSIFTVIPFGVFAVMYGGALPLANLLFARVLSEISRAEDEPNPEAEELKAELTEAKRRLKELRDTLTKREEEVRLLLEETEKRFAQKEEELRSQFAETEKRFAQKEQELRSQLAQTEQALADTEAKFGETGKALALLFGDSKTDRITAAYQLWGGRLKASTIADLAESSASHVSEVLKRVNGHQPAVEVAA